MHFRYVLPLAMLLHDIVGFDAVHHLPFYYLAQLLQRLYHLQMDAFGRLDSRTMSTRSKIAMLEVEGQDIQMPVAEIDPAIQGIPVIDESKDDGKLNSSIFKALRRRQQKTKEEKSQMPPLGHV